MSTSFRVLLVDTSQSLFLFLYIFSILFVILWKFSQETEINVDKSNNKLDSEEENTVFQCVNVALMSTTLNVNLQ